MRYKWIYLHAVLGKFVIVSDGEQITDIFIEAEERPSDLADGREQTVLQISFSMAGCLFCRKAAYTVCFAALPERNCISADRVETAA